MIKVGIVTSTCAAGIKNPTTLEANSIFDKSIKYFEILSNCSLLNFNSGNMFTDYCKYLKRDVKEFCK